jgi:hypothetical protein
VLASILPKSLHPHFVLRRRLEQKGKGMLLRGPFKGLRYGDEAICSALFPKYLGTYESELHDCIEQLIALKPARIVDIGAAEGYYACGLAMRLPEARITAFEADLKARYLLERTIELNRLHDRVDVRRFCDKESLRMTLQNGEGRLAVICDAEGHEHELLCIQEIPELRYAVILVEVHEFILSGVSQILEARFQSSHSITKISARNRTRADFPFSTGGLWERLIPSKYFRFFVDEQRPGGMHWLHMVPLELPDWLQSESR